MPDDRWNERIGGALRRSQTRHQLNPNDPNSKGAGRAMLRCNRGNPALRASFPLSRRVSRRSFLYPRVLWRNSRTSSASRRSARSARRSKLRAISDIICFASATFRRSAMLRASSAHECQCAGSLECSLMQDDRGGLSAFSLAADGGNSDVAEILRVAFAPLRRFDDPLCDYLADQLWQIAVLKLSAG